MAEDADTRAGMHSGSYCLSGKQGPEAREAIDEILALVSRACFEESQVFAIRLALEEAMQNAFRHGNRNDPRKVVTVVYEVDGECIRLKVTDEGGGFDLSSVPDPTRSENLDLPSGRGIQLMCSYMDEVHHVPPGNQVVMTCRRRGGST